MSFLPLYDDAIDLLRALSGPHGIHASATDTTNYRAVFTRDAVMAGVAGLLVGDATVTGGFVRTLEQLRDLQGAQGQIPSNYDTSIDDDIGVSFGTLVPRLDATSWYVIGIALGARAGVLDPAPFAESVHRVFDLLDALEYNGRQLIYVPAGGNWADEYVYEGYILHDQLLRAWALRLASHSFANAAWRSKADHIEQALGPVFWPPGDNLRRYPLASTSPVRDHDVFDLASCSMLALSGIVPASGILALDYIAESFLEHAKLPPAFAPVIQEGDAAWPALRRYHLHGFRNRPHEYHNGGIWMIWIGWLALALAQVGRAVDLERLRAIVTLRLVALGDYRFEEYLHGLSGAPGGTASMAYSATGIVMLHAAGSAAQRRLFAP